jgi:hypothetical protein
MRNATNKPKTNEGKQMTNKTMKNSTKIWTIIFVCFVAWYAHDQQEQYESLPGVKIARRLESARLGMEKDKQASAKKFCEEVRSGIYSPVKAAEIEYKKTTAEYLAAKVKTAEATKAYQLAASSGQTANLEYAQSLENTAYKYAKRDYDRITEATQAERECSQHQ